MRQRLAKAQEQMEGMDHAGSEQEERGQDTAAEPVLRRAAGSPTSGNRSCAQRGGNPTNISRTSQPPSALQEILQATRQLINHSQHVRGVAAFLGRSTLRGNESGTAALGVPRVGRTNITTL